MNKKKFTLSPYLLKLSVKLLNNIAFINLYGDTLVITDGKGCYSFR